MSANRSYAIMAQRAEAMDSLDSAEAWAPIPGWDGYEVSSYGRVRSWKYPGKGRQWLPDDSRPPRLLKQDTKGGYLNVLLSARGARRPVGVHRLVLEAFVGQCPLGFQAAHYDNNPQNNRLDNLRWASPSDNNADKARHGTRQNGERAGVAKLSDRLARQIVRQHRRGVSARELARSFGVHRNSIWNIVSGRTWSHATGVEAASTEGFA